MVSFKNRFLTSAAKQRGGTSPGFVDELVRQPRQFRTPFPDVMATGVAGHGGVHGVHDEVPVVQTAHAPVLPHHGIYGDVCVHQGVLKRWEPSVNYCPCWDLHPHDDLSHLKPAVTFLPRQVEVRYEKGGDHMPHVVVHPACQPQLPHGRIHQRVSCPPSLPGLQVAAVGTPPQSLPAPLDKEPRKYQFFSKALELTSCFYLVWRSEGLPRKIRKQCQLPVRQIPPG